jgi:flagellar biosynthesis/type III secretory pathway M-ring protein FliF/YscJ
MQMLVRIADPVSLQALVDELDARGIGYRVDNSGMHALLPLPDVMDMRVFVDETQLSAARQVVNDLGLGEAA